jgi:hypothetical protein
MVRHQESNPGPTDYKSKIEAGGVGEMVMAPIFRGYYRHMHANIPFRCGRNVDSRVQELITDLHSISHREMVDYLGPPSGLALTAAISPPHRFQKKSMQNPPAGGGKVRFSEVFRFPESCVALLMRSRRKTMFASHVRPKLVAPSQIVPVRMICEGKTGFSKMNYVNI